jgi:hypothetical protein
MTSSQHERHERMERVVASVKTLSATEQEELFKILHSNECEYSRNNNGIFINLGWIDEPLLCKIEKFIEFCHKSRRELDKYENLRKELQAAFQIAAKSRAAYKASLAAANVRATAETAEAAEASDDPEAAEAETADVTEAETADVADVTDVKAGRLASTMRFYLLKKKFAKSNVVVGTRTTDVELSPEPYLMEKMEE